MLGRSLIRVTSMRLISSERTSETDPITGAAPAGVDALASGMWPSPVSSPEVGSIPTQPAPGTYASAQACRSIVSAAPGLGSSWTR